MAKPKATGIDKRREVFWVATISVGTIVAAAIVGLWVSWIVGLTLIGFGLLAISTRIDRFRSPSEIRNESTTVEFGAPTLMLPIVTEQVCRTCKQEKSSDAFLRHGRSKTGLRKSCIECTDRAKLEMEFVDTVYRYGLDRSNCSLCGADLVAMVDEVGCSAFKVCTARHESYARLLCYRMGYGRADRIAPTNQHYVSSEHHASCRIATVFPQVAVRANVLEELPEKCEFPTKFPSRVHFQTDDGEILCAYPYKRIEEEFRTKNEQRVSCNRCVNILA